MKQAIEGWPLRHDHEVHGYSKKPSAETEDSSESVTVRRELSSSVVSSSIISLGSNEAATDETAPASSIRKNFNETAFFFPDLKTDADGSVSFSFTMPEALTQWKLMALAHTKDLSIGYAQKMVITQKQLMVQPNAPRFLRNGDTISFSTKIVNLSPGTLNGQAQLQLFDAASNQPVDGLFNNTNNAQNFTVATGQSVPLPVCIAGTAEF